MEENVANTFARRMNNYRLEKKEVDVKIKVGETVFDAHRIVLREASTFFESLLSENWPKKDLYEIGEEYVSSELMETLLTYIYTSEVNLTTQNARSICMAAHYLNLSDLMSEGLPFLEKTVCSDNALDLFIFASKYEYENLKQICLDSIASNYDCIFQDSKLLTFSDQILKSFIGDLQDYNRSSGMMESQFNLLVRWTEHDSETRETLFPSLFEVILLDHISQSFLHDHVAKQNYVRSSNSCLKMLMDSLQRCFINPQKEVVFNTQCKDSRNFHLLSIGGFHENNLFSFVCSEYTFSDRSWRCGAEMSIPRHRFCGAGLGDQVFIAGGLLNGSSLNLFESYNFISGSLSSYSNLSQGTHSGSMTVFSGQIYMAGG